MELFIHLYLKYFQLLFNSHNNKNKNNIPCSHKSLNYDLYPLLSSLYKTLNFQSTYQRQANNNNNNNTNNSHLIELCKLDIICDIIEELTRIVYDFEAMEMFSMFLF